MSALYTKMILTKALHGTWTANADDAAAQLFALAAQAIAEGF